MGLVILKTIKIGVRNIQEEFDSLEANDSNPTSVCYWCKYGRFIENDTYGKCTYWDPSIKSSTVSGSQYVFLGNSCSKFKEGYDRRANL